MRSRVIQPLSLARASGWHRILWVLPLIFIFCSSLSLGQTDTPTESPTDTQTDTLTDTPSATATDTPTESPTISPTETPTDTPTESPTITPTDTITETPTESPTETPTETPTESPTETPTDTPTYTPTIACHVGWYGTPDEVLTDDPTLRFFRIRLDTEQILNSMTLLVTAAGGRIRAAVYTEVGGVPGTLMVQSLPQDTGVGWNLIALTPTVMPIGYYWLAYQIENGEFARGFASGTRWAYYAAPFDVFPATPPVGLVLDIDSTLPVFGNFCPQDTYTPTITQTPTITGTATNTFTQTDTPTESPTESPTDTPTDTPTITFTPTPTPTIACLVGWTGIPDEIFLTGTQAVRYSLIHLDRTQTLNSMTVFVPVEGGLLSGALYADDGSGFMPGTLIEESAAQTAGEGWNLILLTPTVMPAGDYWLAYQVENGSFSRDDSVPGNSWA